MGFEVILARSRTEELGGAVNDARSATEECNFDSICIIFHCGENLDLASCKCLA